MLDKLFKTVNTIPETAKLNFFELIKELPIYRTLENEFQYKLQNFYDNPHIQSLLDQNILLLKFCMIDFFSKISSLKYQCYLHTGKDITEAYLEDPLLKALANERILYISKFNSYARAFRPLYNIYMKEEANRIFKSLTLRNRLRYFVWRRYKGYVFEPPTMISYIPTLAADDREPKVFFTYETNPFKKNNNVYKKIKEYKDPSNAIDLGGLLLRPKDQIFKN